MAESIATKPVVMIHHHKLECQTTRLVCYLQGHGHIQNMTIAIVFIELLNWTKYKQIGHTLIVSLCDLSFSTHSFWRSRRAVPEMEKVSYNVHYWWLYFKKRKEKKKRKKKRKECDSNQLCSGISNYLALVAVTTMKEMLWSTQSYIVQQYFPFSRTFSEKVPCSLKVVAAVAVA